MYTAFEKSKVIIPKITGLISIFCSIAIIRDLLKGPRAKLEKMTSKLLIAMNISDLIYTCIAHVIGTWFVPKGTLFWSAGNEHTCDIQGWSFNLFGYSAVVYNAALSIVFLLSARYSWSEEDFRKWSYFILCSPPLLVTLLRIPSFGYYKYMNYKETSWHCTFIPSPPGCTITPGMKCNEDNLDIYGDSFLISLCLIFLSCSIIIYSCVRLFLVSRQSDERMIEYRRSVGGNYVNSNRVAVSGLLYSGGNLLVLLPTIILVIGLFAKVNGASFFWTFFGLQLAIFMPLQGFFNALVYFRPQYLEYREKKRREKAAQTANLAANVTSP